MSAAPGVRGTVINIHQNGATVRLEDGRLAAISASELAAHRPAYVSSRDERAPISLIVEAGTARYPLAALSCERSAAIVEREIPQLIDPAFEERMDSYLKSTQEWAPPDRPAPAQRHFIRKKRRAAIFEARNRPT